MNVPRSGRLRRLALVLVATGLLAGGLFWAIRHPDEAPGDLLARGALAIADKKLETAEAALAALERLREPTTDDLLLRAEVSRLRGRDADALAALARIPESDPRAAAVAQTKGLLLLRLDRAREAEAAFQAAVNLDPALDAARRELLRIGVIQFRRDLAERQLEPLARTDGPGLSFDEAFLWTVGTPLDVGPAEAADVLKRWVAADPEDLPSRLGLVEALRRLGRIDEADAVLDGADGSDPRAAAARVELRLTKGDLDAARAELAKRPDDDPLLANARGRLALTAGDADEAVRRFETADRVQPGRRETRFGLAQALRLSGRDERAAPILAEVRARDDLERAARGAQVPALQDDPKTLAAIALACAGLGRRGQARAWYRLALRRDPTNGEVQRALYLLQD